MCLVMRNFTRPQHVLMSFPVFARNYQSDVTYYVSMKSLGSGQMFSPRSKEPKLAK